jgi:hypothetical protein
MRGRGAIGIEAAPMLGLSSRATPIHVSAFTTMVAKVSFIHGFSIL